MDPEDIRELQMLLEHAELELKAAVKLSPGACARIQSVIYVLELAYIKLTMLS